MILILHWDCCHKVNIEGMHGYNNEEEKEGKGRQTMEEEKEEDLCCLSKEFRISNFGLNYPKPELFAISQVSKGIYV